MYQPQITDDLQCLCSVLEVPLECQRDPLRTATLRKILKGRDGDILGVEEFNAIREGILRHVASETLWRPEGYQGFLVRRYEADGRIDWRRAWMTHEEAYRESLRLTAQQNDASDSRAAEVFLERNFLDIESVFGRFILDTYA